MKVVKGANNTIEIEDRSRGKYYQGAAIYKAYSEDGIMVILKASDDERLHAFCELPENILNENGVSYGNLSQTLEALNAFIGSFRSASATGGNSGGGVSPVSDTSWKREYVPLPANHQYAIRLKNNTETVISTALWSEVIVDVTCPREEAGKMTTCILVFSTEETVPRLNLPTNVVWKGETAPPLNPNTIYRLLFNIYEDKVLVNTF